MYAALCKVVRECGFKVTLVARYGAIPEYCKFLLYAQVIH